MRSVPSGPAPGGGGAVLLDDKIHDVTHYMQSHAQTQHAEEVTADPNGQLMNVQVDAGNRIVTVVHPSGYSSQMCRQVALGGESVMPEGVSSVGGGGWAGEELIGAELTEEDGRLAAALVAVHLANSNGRVMHVRQDVDPAVLMDGNIRLFNSHGIEDQHDDTMVVEVPSLPALPPLQDMSMKTASWYHTKNNKDPHKEELQIINDDRLELSSPAQSKQSRKSLPHKKRISRKLRRPPGAATGAGTPRHDGPEEILPDSFEHAPGEDPLQDVHHIAHEVRAILICQICGDFYGEEQLKFFHHLKQHYEPQGATIIIENPVGQMQPVGDLEKMGACIVDHEPPLPDSLVELSLEGGVASKLSLYHSAEKHVLYTSGDRTLTYMGNKCTYSTAIVERDDADALRGAVGGGGGGEAEAAAEPREQQVYSCTRCSKSFRKQRLCEAHIKEAHPAKLREVDEMSEFSEPEDLMEGIHVLVEGGEVGAVSGGGFLTVDSGHVHQEHMKHWYQLEQGEGEAAGGAAAAVGAGAAGGGGGDACAVCTAPLPTREALEQHMQTCPMHLKEEVFQRIFDAEVDSGNMLLDNEVLVETSEHQATAVQHQEHQEPTAQRQEGERESAVPKQRVDGPMDEVKSARPKVFECQDCGRVFNHRNSLQYHIMSHKGLKAHQCVTCKKSFMTSGALKVHERIHDGSKPYKCLHCERNFRQWGDLKYHVISLHSNEKNYKCEYCSKEFARKYSLNIHIRIHTGERNYKCEYCNKSFRASSYRLAHMRIHTGERPFSCVVCGKNFRVAGDMRRHMIVHEKVRVRNDDKAKKPKKGSPVKLVNIKIRSEPTIVLNGSVRSDRRKVRAGELEDEQILPDHKLEVEQILPDQIRVPEDDYSHDSSSVNNRTSAENFSEQKELVQKNEILRKILQQKGNIEMSKRSGSPPRNITPFEHLQKREPSGAHNQIHISDVRSYADKPERANDSLENSGFLSRLTEIYSITPVT